MLTSLKEKIVSFLRKTEHITRTDNVYLIKNGSYLVFTHGVGVLNGFILYILIAHFLPKEIYGQYKYLLSLFSLFAVTTFTGLDIALVRAVARGAEGSLQVAFRRKLLGSLVGSGLTLLLSGYYFLQGRADLTLPLICIAVFAPLIYATNIYTAFLNGKKEFGLYSRITLFTTILSFVGMALAFIVLRNPTAIFVVFLLTGLVNVLAYLYARTKQKNTITDPGLLSYGTHLSLLDILGIVANGIDGVLIFHFLGATSLAVYALAIIPVDQLKGLLKTTQAIALPKFSVGNLQTVRASLRRKLALFMLLITFLVGIYILLAPLFFKVFFPAYLSSVPYSQVYSLSLIFAMPASVLVTLFMAKQMRKETIQFNVFNYSIQIILLVFGSWLYGLWGAILSRMISRILMLGTTHWMLSRANSDTTNNDL